jgi:hypothetical protein
MDLLQIESQEHDPAQQWLSMPFRFHTPIGHKNYFFVRPLFLLLLPPRHHFFASSLPFSFFLHDDRRTDGRTNEQTNERTVTLPISRHVDLLLTITNFLPFASLLLLLTLDRLQR